MVHRIQGLEVASSSGSFSRISQAFIDFCCRKCGEALETGGVTKISLFPGVTGDECRRWRGLRVMLVERVGVPSIRRSDVRPRIQDLVLDDLENAVRWKITSGR